MFEMEMLKLLITSIAIPFGLYILNRLGALAKALEDHKLYAANTYLKKNEVQEMRKEFRESLAELKNDIHKALDELKQHKGKNG